MTDFKSTEKARTRSEAGNATAVTSSHRQQTLWHAMMSYLSGELSREEHRAARDARERGGDRDDGQASTMGRRHGVGPAGRRRLVDDGARLDAGDRPSVAPRVSGRG